MPPRRPHGGHASLRFKALKAELAARFDLNTLKEPHPEYTALFGATLASHLALFAGCRARSLAPVPCPLSPSPCPLTPVP